MDRNFFATPLGRASLASIAAMTALVALTTRAQVGADMGIAEMFGQPAPLVELA